MIYIISGVSGAGKSTIGQALAQVLKLQFFDGDDFHPIANIQKMERGIALDDEDRAPWLNELAGRMKEWNKQGGAVLACSALKEKYRRSLLSINRNEIKHIFLNADPSIILERLKQREDHFMSLELLASQFEILEIPDYGIHVEVNKSPEQILKDILENLNDKSELGLIGLGVMGKSLALNIARNKFSLSVYNRHVPGKEEDIANNFSNENQTLNIQGFDDLQKFVNSLGKPRNILLMVNAGKAVDQVIDKLRPLLDSGDLIIDGGNSHFLDTKRRFDDLQKEAIEYVGMGISGGEEGALKGPSMMPGGSEEGFSRIAFILKKIAAKDKNGKPCSSYIGPDGAGHFLKMIHNGIEYAEMQLIAEIYHLLRFHIDMSPDDISDLYSNWYREGLASYLLEISIEILKEKEGDAYLIDLILDKAGQKGTGGWSTNAALTLGKPLNTISDAVMARYISAMKDLRTQAAETYQKNYLKMQDLDLDKLKDVYQAARIINHTIGFDLLQEASKSYQWNLNLSEIARIWTNGCIIRSELMEELIQQLRKSPEHLLLHPTIVSKLNHVKSSYAEIVGEALKAECSIPVLSSALNYFLGFISAQSPANMIQAQRDYFGAHTFQRVDKPGQGNFHHNW